LSVPWCLLVGVGVGVGVGGAAAGSGGGGRDDDGTALIFLPILPVGAIVVMMGVIVADRRLL
jgi:hypothetical protein